MAKKTSRKAKRNLAASSDNLVYNTKFGMERVVPMTDTQEDVFDSYYSGKNLLLHGTAGTGKTFLSLYLALEEVFSNGEFNKIVIVRSAVQTRDMGHQPGDEGEKMSFFESTYRKNVNKLLGRGDAYEILKKKGMIEFASTSFLRGETYDNTIIIVDEAQSMGFHELDTIITRVGDYAKIIFCGDTKQNDLIKSKYDVSGLAEFKKVIDTMPSFDSVEFTVNDVVRSGLVKEYILAKEALAA